MTFSAGSYAFDDVTVQSRSPQLPESTRAYRADRAGDGSAVEFRGAEVRDRVAVVRRSDRGSDGPGRRGGEDRGADLPRAAPLPVASPGTDDTLYNTRRELDRLVAALHQEGDAFV
ncbi:hypothetical protein [Streptomyces sp. NPDC047065]|uniref:hypothetical protein n=1 Tax=Streptomyces sp. NPDC047065 TaxID=3154606 RepID=UPI0033C8A5D7